MVFKRQDAEMNASPSRGLRLARCQAAGVQKSSRARSACARTAQPSAWSLIRPIACMKAWTVVGPTNFQPRFFRSFDIAIDAGDVEARRGALAFRLEAPHIGPERTRLAHQILRAASIVDHRLDLAAMSDNSGILQQAFDIAPAEPGDAIEYRSRRMPRENFRAS